MAQQSRVSAAAAAELVNQGHKYLDVRTPEEWSAGHPKGAVNIPFMLLTPEGMQPNPDFLQKVKESFETTAPLVVGCSSGNRSARARALLQQEQFCNLVDNSGGFDGWVADGLPVGK